MGVRAEKVILHICAVLHQQKYGQLTAFGAYQGLSDFLLERGAMQHDIVCSYHHVFSTFDSLINNVSLHFAENAARAWSFYGFEICIHTSRFVCTKMILICIVLTSCGVNLFVVSLFVAFFVFKLRIFRFFKNKFFVSFCGIYSFRRFFYYRAGNGKFYREKYCCLKDCNHS